MLVCHSRASGIAMGNMRCTGAENALLGALNEAVHGVCTKLLPLCSALHAQEPVSNRAGKRREGKAKEGCIKMLFYDKTFLSPRVVLSMQACFC